MTREFRVVFPLLYAPNKVVRCQKIVKAEDVDNAIIIALTSILPPTNRQEKGEG
jgi:hypothetical protein